MTIALLAALCASCARPLFGQAGAAAGDTLRYTFLSASRPSGEMKVWRTTRETRHVTYEFNDRGRGPRLTQRMVLGSDGVPTETEISGHDYFKNAVEERFSTRAGRAMWSNGAERDSAQVGAFYSAFYGTPEESAVLARALLRVPSRTLRVFPAGEARIDKVGDLTIAAGDSTKSVTHYAISGLNFTPTSLWLDGESHLFAAGGSWAMVIRQGWEGAQSSLLAAQDSFTTNRATSLAKSLVRRPRGPLAFRNATIFDADSRSMRRGMTVVVNGNKISAVGARVPLPRDAEVIDATGKTLLPGLWDMHVHVDDVDGLFQIAAGVTTVRDLANDTDELLARRRRFDEGTLIGPRIILAGFMDGPGPFAGPTKVLVSTPEQVRAAVATYDSLGYEQIKMYSSIDTALVPAIVAAAHERGMLVSGHIPAFMSAERAVQLGFDEIQHANMLFLNFWADEVKDTRTPLRFTAVAERGALLDLKSDRVRAFVRLLRERNVIVDPTVNIFENMFTARKGSVSPGYASIAHRLPPQVKRGFLGGGLPVPEGMDARYRESFANMLRFVKLLHDSGIRIVPGTDAFAGFALHRELELYDSAGIPPTDVLYLATLGAARVMKRDAQLGSIKVGKLADLVLIDGDPSRRMSDIRKTALVVKDGLVYRPDDLYHAVGVRSTSAF